MNYRIMTHELDRTSAVPLYIQLHSILRRSIVGGDEFQEGRLPTEFELAQSFGVGRITVSQALAMLEEEKLVCRIKRRGTVLTSHLNTFDPQNGARTIGVVFPETHSWNETLPAIRAAGESRGLTVQIFLYPWGDLAKESAAIKKAREKCVGIILYPNTFMSDCALIDSTNKSGYPLVLFDLYSNYLDCNGVSSDHCYGGYAVARELFKLGLKRPGMSVRPGSDTMISEKQRADGFLQFCAEQRKRVKIFHSGKDSFVDYLKNSKIDSLFFSAPMAEYNLVMQDRAVRKIILERGIKLAHFDAWPKEDLTAVKVIQDEKTLAASAVHLLVELLLDPAAPHKKIIVAPQAILTHFQT